MSEWYKNRFRRTLLDMHIEDWDESFLSEYNPKGYLEALKKANIDAPMIYVQSHVGLCYWPTKSGIMHKAFEGKEDQVKQLFDLCHADGMDTVLYYSIIFNNREYDRHPEWRMRDVNGDSSRSNGMRYGLCCPNNKEYVEFVHRQIEEFSEYFDYEGVFFDMTFWPQVCYCDSCKAKWEAEVGGEMPAVVDWNDPRWCALNQKQYEWLGAFARDITAKAKKEKPGITVEHQYGPSMNYWRYGNNENVAEASDYIGTDLYGGIKQHSFACKAWYNLTKNQPFQYMTSRCDPNLSEHTNTKTRDQLMQCVAMTYAHHGASFMIDAIDPVGTFDERVYDLLGSIYGETEAYEKYFSRGYMAYDIGIYFNMNGKMDVEAKPLHILDHKLDRGNIHGGCMPHVEALFGVCDALTQNHMPYGVINQSRLNLIDNCKVLVLSDVPKMQEKEISYIKDYVSNGGNLYMSGHSAPELLEEFFGLKWNGYTEETTIYMAPTDEDRFISEYFTKKYPLPMQEKAVVASGEVKGKVLATLTLPYTVPNLFTYVCPTEMPAEAYISEDSSAYPFSTIHANPPGVEKDAPALVENVYGKGKVIWSAVPIEKPERYQHNNIFANIIKYLADDNLLVGGKASESVEYIAFQAPEYNQILVGLVETKEYYCIPESINSEVWVRVDTEPKSVVVLPDEESIPYVYEDGVVKFTIDKFHIWKMVAINY